MTETKDFSSFLLDFFGYKIRAGVAASKVNVFDTRAGFRDSGLVK